MRTPVDLFKDVYNRLNASTLHLLGDLYTEGVVFQDPFRRLEGLEALRHYCEELYRDTESSSFQWEQELTDGGSAMLMWTMSLKHPRLNGGDLIQVPGATHIRFRDKVFFHRDYFDGGALIYEHVPLLGLFVRAIKSRV